MVAYLYLTKQIGIAVAFSVWAYIVAKGVFARSSLRLSFVEEMALLVPAGLAVAIGLLFVLGLAGVLTTPGILAVGGLALAFAGWRLREHLASGLSVSGLSRPVCAMACRETLARLVMALIAGAVLIPFALKALTPPYFSDEVRYHLPYALHFVEQGRIVPDLYLRYPFHTLNVNLLYTVALIFGDDVTPHYIHLLLGCLAGLALYVLAAPKCGRVIAFCAVLLFFVTPTFRNLAAVAYVDLGLAAFVISTIACLDRARGRSALVVCAGLAFGAALGTKYLALALFPLVVAWAAYRTRDGLQVARFAAIALLTGSPWYIYNFIWTGNPVSPFAGEWFGWWPWTAEDLASQTNELTQLSESHSLSNLASLPYDLIFEPSRFRVGSVPALAFGLVALVLLPWWSPKMRPYGIFVLVVVTVWFFTSSIFRYLAAILPMWCFISVWSVERMLLHIVSLVARGRIIAPVGRRYVSYAVAVIVLVFVVHYFRVNWLDAAAVTERVVHRDRFLRKNVPIYGVAEYLRRTGVQDEVIFVFPPGALFSYARKNRIVGDYFGPMAYLKKLFKNLPRSSTSSFQDRFLEQLQGVSLLVLSRDFLRRYTKWRYSLPSFLAVEYIDGNAVVFRMKSDTEPPDGDRQQGCMDARHAYIWVEEDDSVHIVPYLPSDPAGLGGGFVRVVNHSHEAGTVALHRFDDAGNLLGTSIIALEAGEVVSFKASDWAACDLAKDVPGRLGDDEARSGWLSLATELDIEVASYLRTRDTVATSLHEVVRTTQDSDDRTIHHVPFFNPGSERSQASHLRLINPGDRDVAVAITGRDDAGGSASEEVRLLLPGGTACWLNASVLESGAADGDGPGCHIVSGRLGNGQGRWRLSVAASGGDIQVMNLMVNSTGHVTNLSASGGVKSGTYTLPYVLPVPDSTEEPHGFVRIINHSNAAGTVEIHGTDDTGASHGPVTLTLDGQEAVHLGSGDLEAGNASKGLPEGLGDGDGSWRLRLATELKIEALAYVRKQDEIVTSTHEVARAIQGEKGETVHYVPFFNPGRNKRRASWLRLSNSGRRNVEVTIEGYDDAGVAAPEVSLMLPAGQACALSASTLESGKPESDSDTCTGEQFDFTGRFGVGTGKWSLFVIAEGGDIQVMSLLKSRTGYLTNLSVPNRMSTARSALRKLFNALPNATLVQIENWGPRSSGIGESFNVQPNGNSALWFRVQQLERNTDYRIYVGSQSADTTISVERNAMSAGLTPGQSRRIVSTEGKIPIHLVAPFRGKQLIGHFHVQPR